MYVANAICASAARIYWMIVERIIRADYNSAFATRVTHLSGGKRYKWLDICMAYVYCALFNSLIRFLTLKNFLRHRFISCRVALDCSKISEKCSWLTYIMIVINLSIFYYHCIALPSFSTSKNQG